MKTMVNLAPEKQGFEPTEAIETSPLREDVSGEIAVSVQRCLDSSAEMNAEYFNQQNVRADLQAFADAAGITIADLNTGSKCYCSATLSNGQTMNIHTYVFTAIRAFGRQGSGRKLAKHLAPTLYNLQILIGEASPEMNAEYFTQETILKDFESYRAHAGFESIEDIITTVAAGNFKCCNGEEMHFITYLTRAGKAFGLGERTIDIKGNYPEVLERLKTIAEIKFIPRMTKEYFSQENIVADLLAFAKSAGIDFHELRTFSHGKVEALCANGGTMRLQRYVSKAGIAFDFGKTSQEASGSRSKILKYLKQIAVDGNHELKEYPVMNRSYFSYANVQKDMEAMGKGVGKSIVDLTTDFRGMREFEAANGELINPIKYLSRAAVAFKLAETHQEASGCRAATLVELKKKVNIEPLEECYFTPTQVALDLRVFAKAAMVKVEELNSHNAQDNIIKCCNGRHLSFAQYRSRAGVALGMINRLSDANPITKELIKKLKEFAGIEIFEKIDLVYLTRANIRADIEVFAEASGIEVEELNATNARDVKAKIQTGKTLKWQSFYERVGKVLYCLKYQKQLKESGITTAQIVDDIFQIYGFDSKIVECSEMDVDYFTPETIKEDLQAFADVADLTVEELRRSSARGQQVKCKNGESLILITYISRVAVALGFAINNTEVNKCGVEMLNKVKVFAGIKPMEAMTEAYFTRENVLKDLTAWAESSGQEISELGTTQGSIKFKAGNFETMSGNTYIDRVGNFFNFKRNERGRSTEFYVVLRFLFRIAGMSYEVYKEMDEDYFNNPINLRADLKAFAIVVKMPVEKMLSSHFKKKQAVCRNGEAILGSRYLTRAAKALGFVEFAIEAPKFHRQILEQLKQIANA